MNKSLYKTNAEPETQKCRNGKILTVCSISMCCTKENSNIPKLFPARSWF